MINKKLKNDKKGWLKIVEAFLAILIILGGVLYLMSINTPKNEISQIVYEKQKYILEGISKNESMRAYILEENNIPIDDFIKRTIPPNWHFQTRICPINLICNPNNLPPDKEIYSSEIIIIANDTKYSPKKLRFFTYG